MKFRNRGAGSMNFLKLAAGESVRGVFQGEPHEFKQHWVNNKGELCRGADCGYCHPTDPNIEPIKPGFRFRLNIIIKENESYTCKIFEQGWTVYEALKALHEGDYQLNKYLMKITRNGSGKETTYSIVPVPNGMLSDAQLDQISKIDLLPLGHE